MVAPFFVCQNLSKVFKGLGDEVSVALDGVSFSLERCDRLFICGHNGSGKTTILRIIAGQQKPDSGEILFNDGSGLKDWDRFRSDSYIWVPQRLHDVTVDYVRINELVSISDREKIIHLAKKVQADWLVENIEKGRQSKLVGELSGGQKQLLLSLIALAENRPILLLDEVFNSLDFKMVPLYWKLTQDYINESNGCAIIVTQDLRFAKENATRLLVMERGKVLVSSAPSEISLEQLVSKVLGR